MQQADVPSEISFLLPEKLSFPPAWCGHIPFAMWLVENVRPQSIVELGVHSGNSYFAFCQAIKHLSIPCSCFAIDTWSGDSHAGYYEENIYDDVKAYNLAHYSPFSTLMRMTFDQARTHFSDNSIDILHIDGLHSYEAVSHDFYTWLPTVSERGIVLFHDIVVRDDDFGVWKLWDELSKQYPSIDFLHSNGLGVLGVGKNLSPAFMSLVEAWKNPDQRRRIRTMYDRLGQVSILTQNLDEQRHHNTRYLDMIHQLQYEVAAGQEKLEWHETRDLLLNEKITELARYEADFHAILGSTSWKLTAPFRQVAQKYPFLHRAVQSLKPLAKLVLRPLSESRTVSSAQTNSNAPVFPEVARPIENDASIAVPLTCSTEIALETPSIAVMCHMYYEEIAEEFRQYLINIPFDFTLYISTDAEDKKTIISKFFMDWHTPLVIRVAPNQGRDISHKLVCFGDIYSNHEYVLFLHSKRSEHASVLANWRGFLLESLLGSPQIVKSIITMFTHRHDLGIVAPQHFETVRHWINWGNNFCQADMLAQRMGIVLNEKQVLDFPSGSMFWARTAALQPLLDLNLTYSNFQEESGQIDGTLAHAIERIFYHVCEKAGFTWLKVTVPDFSGQTPAISNITSFDDLDTFIQDHALQLTGKNLPSPRKKHPKPIAQADPALVARIQDRSLGLLSAIESKPYKITIGMVTYNNHQPIIQRAIDSALLALKNAGQTHPNQILVIDNGNTSGMNNNLSGPVYSVPSHGNIGFGAAHNLLMQEAFNTGADLYIAVNPDGALHPDAVQALQRMVQAHAGRALVEAIQFPEEHSKAYDPYTLETPWVSGACLAIPHAAFLELGGFAPEFFMYCEDVDLSWRARAHGFVLRICPAALFFHEVTNRELANERRKMIFDSGVILARKWGNPAFENWLVGELAAMGYPSPISNVTPVPLSWHKYADFTHEFSFSITRW